MFSELRPIFESMAVNKSSLLFFKQIQWSICRFESVHYIWSGVFPSSIGGFFSSIFCNKSLQVSSQSKITQRNFPVKIEKKNFIILALSK